jgi:hypothetical protein
MSSPSNLYAEKIFAEHPISLWALDDAADYIDLLTDAKRDFSLWSITGGTSEILGLAQYDQPFVDSPVVRLEGAIPSSESGQIVFVSSNVLNLNTLNDTLGTFSIGCVVNSESAYLSSVEIGYEYDNPVVGENPIQELKRFNASFKDRWFFISQTVETPNVNANVRIVLKINYIGGATETDSYRFLVNGFTFGQWSEEFNASSLGVQKVLVPSSIALPTTYGIEASAYGLQENKGYYLLSDNALLAKNTGIPLVYGASNLTRLSPNNNLPSLIIPGLGFLGEDGQYKDYTLEMWLRVNSDSSTSKRIVGPIGSTDGLYVNGPFLTLKINNNIGSYYVGEWARPMLIHIRVSNNYASLLVNGEEVISLNYITSDLSFPSRLNSDGKDQDWLGFYAYNDVTPVEVDCVALYTYQVPIVLAKKRFVYGQGVEFPEGINQAYSGSSVYIDYPFADYTNNYSYPTIGNWNQATIDNLVVKNNTLTTPDYSLPSIVLSNGTTEDFYSDMKQLNEDYTESDTFLSFKNLDGGHLVFEDLNFLKQNIKSFYGSFKFLEEPTSQQTLLRLESDITSDYFEVVTDGLSIKYNLSYMSNIETLATFSWMGIGEIFSVGIDIDRMCEYYGGSVSSFFGNINSLKCYVGGMSDLSETFQGNIYKIGFCTARNHQKIKDLFSERGVPIDYESVFDSYMETPDVDYNSTDDYFGTSSYIWEEIIDGGFETSFASDGLQAHTASYTLVPQLYFDNYALDIDIHSYWEDYVPVTYFAQYVEDEFGDLSYDVDFIQFNINYPSPSKTTDDIYDASNSMLRSYVSFQYVQNGANLPETNFTNIELPSSSLIVSPQSDWMQTRYEVLNNSIIYMPDSVSKTDLALVTHLDFNVKGILKNKITIRSLEYASQAFNSTSPNPIGTRFGNEIYPYKKSGFYYSYKDQNPFSIYKGSSPYLYLTRYSGIEVKGDNHPGVNRGLAIPINTKLATNYKVMAMQSAIRYDHDSFPTAPVEIFEIESKNAHIKFFLVSVHSSGERGKIYAVNAKNGIIEEGIGFYWNGKIVREPVINIKEWGFLGISFPNTLDFKNVVGAIRINGPMTFNTISHYQSTNLQEVQQVEVRPWFNVKYVGPLTLEWDYWRSSSFVWNEVLVLSSTSYYGVDPSTIYKSYTGTNKIIIDSEKVLTLNKYEYNVYQDITWQQTTSNAV